MANKIIKYEGIELPIRTYASVRVLTTMDINKLHKFHADTKLRKNKYKDGKDYYRLPSETFKMYGDNPHYNYPHGGYLITEEGYKKLFPKGDKIAEYVLSHYYHDYVKPILQKTEKEIDQKKTKVPVDIKEDITLGTYISMFKQLMNVFDTQIKNQEKILNELSNIKEMILNGRDDEDRINTDNTCNGDSTHITKKMNYPDWKKDILEFVANIVSISKRYRRNDDVLSEAYTELRNQYGVVWEQEKKDYRNVYGRSPISTLELAWWIERKPAYEGLLKSKLVTIYNNEKENN